MDTPVPSSSPQDPTPTNVQPSPAPQLSSQPLTQTPLPQTPPLNNFSVVPIIITAAGGVLYSILLIMNLLVLFRAIKFLNITGFIGQQTLPLAILPIIAFTFIVFANFGFASFLISKRKKGENVNKSVLASIVISVPPIVVLIGMYFLVMNLNAFT